MRLHLVPTALLVVLLTAPVFAQEGPPPEPPPEVSSATKPEAIFALHPEMFFSMGHAYVDRTPEPDGHVPGAFTLSYGVQFGFGTKKWVTCDPHADPECTEKNGPRLTIGGLMLGWTVNTDLGLGLQFPLVTVRIVRNAWLGTAVTVYPWAPDGRRNVAFTIGLSICTSPDDGL